MHMFLLVLAFIQSKKQTKYATCNRVLEIKNMSTLDFKLYVYFYVIFMYVMLCMKLKTKQTEYLRKVNFSN